MSSTTYSYAKFPIFQSPWNIIADFVPSAIMASVDLDSSISGWTPLAVKIADLYSFGQGGDANSRTRSKAPDFDNDGLQVLAVDSGTWPNEGGGVSACRRNMINNLRSVHWHLIAESANGSALPKHQVRPSVLCHDQRLLHFPLLMCRTLI